jgi:chromosome segregation ATPase
LRTEGWRVKLRRVSDLSSLIERVERRCRRVATATPGSSGPLRDVEDLLSEGYVVAMSAERRSRHLEDRMATLAQHVEDPRAAIELSELALEKRTVDQRVRVLRESLARLREQFVRLGGHLPTSR